MKRSLAMFMVLLSTTGLLAQLTVTDRGFPVRDRTIQTGMMTLSLKEGTALVLELLGRPAGILFEGSGTYSVRVTDPFALQVLPFNVKHGSRLKVETDTVSDDLDHCVLLGHDILSLIPENTVKAPDHRGVLDYYEERVSPGTVINPAAFILSGLVNETAEWTAMMKGSKDLVAYTYDPLWEQTERFICLEQTEIRQQKGPNYHIQHDLVNQPLGRSPREPLKPQLVLTGMHYDADFKNIKSMSCTFRQTYWVGMSNIRAIRLNLVSINYYTYGENLIPTYLNVDGVLGEDSKPLDFHHFGNTLTIMLEQPPPSPGKLDLVIRCSGNIFRPDPNMGSFVALHDLSWFPSPPGGFEAVEALFSGKITTPSDLLSFASFENLNRSDDDDTRTLEGDTKRPMSMHSLLLGKYNPTSLKVKETDITIASAVFKNERAYKILTSLSEGSLDCYNYFLGDYPFGHLQIIEGKGYGYGKAPPTMVLASGEIFNSLRDEEAQVFSEGANERFAHEVAHQYFGHLVRTDKTEEFWLEEALSDYLAGIFIKEAKGKTAFKFMYTNWYSRGKSASDKASLYSASRLAGLDADYHRYDLIYGKGPVVIHAIKDRLGEKAFWKIIRSFLLSFPNKVITTKDFLGLLNYVTKEDWNPFFEQYVYGMDMPPKAKPK